MADSIDLAVNSTVYGVDILILVDNVDGFVTLSRVTPAGTKIVRGMESAAVITSQIAITDTEGPLGVDTYYVVDHLRANGARIITTSSTLSAGWAGAFPPFVLRDLYQGATGIVTDFQYGPIADNEINYRGGKFTVIGRPDPIIVIDVRASQEAQMVFITMNETATMAVRALAKAAHPLLLQSPQAYLLGEEGVIYFFPSKTSEQHILPDGRYAHRRFVVDYTEIAQPSSAVVFVPEGLTYADVAQQYDTYQDIIDASLSYVNLAYGPVFGAQ